MDRVDLMGSVAEVVVGLGFGAGGAGEDGALMLRDEGNSEG